MELFTFTKPDVCTDATLKKTKEGEKSLWSAASVSLGQAASKNSWYYFCWLFLFKIPIYQYNDITSLKQYNSFFFILPSCYWPISICMYLVWYVLI